MGWTETSGKNLHVLFNVYCDAFTARNNSKASYHFARLAEARFGSMFLFQGGRHRLRWLTLLSGLVENLFFGGIVFGWASLVFALKADGYFAEYCVNVTRVEDNAVSIGI